MAIRTLWRIAGASTTTAHPDRLIAGLRLHLRYAALTSVLMQIGAQQQAYVALVGCEGCAHGRCAPGCRADLFGRMLRASIPACDPRYVASGLAARPYTRAALAWPAPRAQALTGALLHAWAESRLVLHWPRASGRTPTVAALVLTSSAGPEPASVLRSCGWRAIALPAPLVLRLAKAPIPTGAPIGARWAGAPTLLLAEPAVAVRANLPAPPPHSHADDSVLAAWVEGVLAAATTPSPEQERTAPADDGPERAAAGPEDVANGWPVGPCGMRPAALAALIERMLTDPTVLRMDAPQISQRGLVYGRLAALSGVSDELAKALMVWFDAAGILQEPARPERRWRQPRLLVHADPAWLAEQLRATPLPPAEAVRAAFAPEQTRSI
jgi:hypothetical protein